VELGRADAPGRPILYGTSTDFLERFGLLSLDALPMLEAGVAERLVATDAPETGDASGDAGRPVAADAPETGDGVDVAEAP
jgi:Segregation and condensation complex subunit ScpB